MIRVIVTVLFSLASIHLLSQTFYVSVPQKYDNKGFELHVNVCDSLPMYVCPAPADTPINNGGFYFGDMAMDSSNFYYVSVAGNLYSRGINDSNCQYLGEFGHNINALVADCNGKLYASGTKQNVCKLLVYDVAAHTFTDLGVLPLHCYSSGDLFFYENRLFLTAVSNQSGFTFLEEINILNPSLSCYYMPLPGGIFPYGAFSVDYRAYSKVFITNHINNSNWASLREIDITNKSVGPEICLYPFDIWGATTMYGKTNVTEFCTPVPVPIIPTSGVANGIEPLPYVNIRNPATGHIDLNANLDDAQIAFMGLRDMTGKLVKRFTTSTLLEISELAGGLYVFELRTTSGESYRRKLIITR
jgi:hypothetical protein